MDRGSQLDEDDEDDEDDEEDEEDEEEEDEEERRRRRTRQEEEATDIKSNNPHLAGGEQNHALCPLNIWSILPNFVRVGCPFH